MDAEAVIHVLLDRIQRNSGSLVKASQTANTLRAELSRARETLDISQEGNRRHHRDMKAAEAKIGEWAEYASSLRSAINAIDPRALKRKQIVLPDMPRPLETEIPF